MQVSFVLIINNHDFYAKETLQMCISQNIYIFVRSLTENKNAYNLTNI